MTEQEILRVLNIGQLTTREIATCMGYTDLELVYPIISRLILDGKITICGYATDPISLRTVALYKRTYVPVISHSDDFVQKKWKNKGKYGTK